MMQTKRIARPPRPGGSAVCINASGRGSGAGAGRVTGRGSAANAGRAPNAGLVAGRRPDADKGAGAANEQEYRCGPG
jgi:hypothetical protein